MHCSIKRKPLIGSCDCAWQIRSVKPLDLRPLSPVFWELWNFIIRLFRSFRAFLPLTWIVHKRKVSAACIPRLQKDKKMEVPATLQKLFKWVDLVWIYMNSHVYFSFVVNCNCSMLCPGLSCVLMKYYLAICVYKRVYLWI